MRINKGESSVVTLGLRGGKVRVQIIATETVWEREGREVTCRVNRVFQVLVQYSSLQETLKKGDKVTVPYELFRNGR